MVTSTLDDAESVWRNSTAIGGYSADRIRALKDEVDGDLYVSGSATLVRALLADGLVDGLHLYVNPLAVGTGIDVALREPDDRARTDPGTVRLALYCAGHRVSLSTALPQLHALGLDAAVVAAYGLILPRPVLDAPALGCLNVHASLLPRWRGAAPINRAIMAGDAESGVCVMKMEEGLDTGGVHARREVPIGPRTTAAELREALVAAGTELLVDVLSRPLGPSEPQQTDRHQPDEQPGAAVAHARRLRSPSSAAKLATRTGTPAARW